METSSETSPTYLELVSLLARTTTLSRLGLRKRMLLLPSKDILLLFLESLLIRRLMKLQVLLKIRLSGFGWLMSASRSLISLELFGLLPTTS